MEYSKEDEFWDGKIKSVGGSKELELGNGKQNKNIFEDEK